MTATQCRERGKTDPRFTERMAQLLEDGEKTRQARLTRNAVKEEKKNA